MLYNKNLVKNDIISKMHNDLLEVKLLHYKTSSYAEHMATNRTYDSLDEIIDEITEKLIGYGMEVPNKLEACAMPKTKDDLCKCIYETSEMLKKLASDNNWPDIENLSQSYSGIGAQLKYLNRLS